MKLLDILNEYKQDNEYNDKLKEIKDLYNKIKNYAYIFKLKENPYTSPAKKFDQQRGGFCYDYANYVYHTLSHLKPKAYFIEFVDDNYQDGSPLKANTIAVSHAFPVFLINNKYIVLEAAYKKIAGVHIFNSEKEMISFYNRFVLRDEKPTKLKLIKTFTYIPKNTRISIGSFGNDINSVKDGKKLKSEELKLNMT